MWDSRMRIAAWALSRNPTPIERLVGTNPLRALACHREGQPLAMYNGIGILTPRGSGTSGYVTTNKFNLRPGAAHRVDHRDSRGDAGPQQRQPNKGILDHNRKREIELEIAKLEEQLMDEE